MTSQAGDRKERNDFYPFGTYRASTDYDASFPDALYTFTAQDEDDDLAFYNYGARLYDSQLGRFLTADPLVQAPGDPQTLNRYSYCRNNPLIRVDPTGNFDILEFFKSLFTGFVGGLTFVLSGGDTALAGIAAGVLSGAMSGKIENVVAGATIGGIAGGTVGGVNAAYPGYGTYGVLGIGGAVSAYNGPQGIADYGAGLLGSLAGAVVASDATAPPSTKGHAFNDDPLRFNRRELTATDAEGNVVGSWPATSGRPGSTTSLTDQMRRDFGPIPEGVAYTVNPANIQRWVDLPWHEKIAAYLPGKHGKWPGGVIAWGHTRVPIDIPGGAVVFSTPGVPPRGGFFIHGGWYPGSAGCIDLGGHEKSFFEYFSAQRGAVPLTVNYGN